MYKAIKRQLSYSRLKKKVFSANFLFVIVVIHSGLGSGIFFAFVCFYIKLLLDLDIHALIA